MIFRLAVLVCVLAFATAQEIEVRDDGEDQEVSARLMQQTVGFGGVDSETAGTVGAIARDPGSAGGPLTSWTWRWEIEEGVRDDQSITGVFLHCATGVGPTETAPQLRSLDVNIDETQGALTGGGQIISMLPDTINLITTGDNCYLNFTSDEYPAGELRSNIDCSLTTADTEITTCGSASTLMASSALVLSILAGATLL